MLALGSVVGWGPAWAGPGGGAGKAPALSGGEKDTDGDGLADFMEFHKYGTDPFRARTGAGPLADGDWGQRRQFTYSIAVTLELARPFNLNDMNDDYQDARILSESEHGATVELVLYPYTSNAEAIGENFNWKSDYAGMKEYLDPTPSENWDPRMREDLLKELAEAGIFPDRLSDKLVAIQVAKWALKRGQPVQHFTSFFVDFKDGAPHVAPELREAFDSQKPDDETSDQTIFDHEILGKQMFYSRKHGSCTSYATYLATVLRAIGLPTRIVVCIPVADPNDQAQLELLRSGLTDPAIKLALDKGLKEKGFCDHMFNEVYVGNRWVRLNYATLGQNILDAHFFGLMAHVLTARSASEIPLASTWGIRFGLRRNARPQLASTNPYRLLKASDLNGGGQPPQAARGRGLRGRPLGPAGLRQAGRRPLPGEDLGPHDPCADPAQPQRPPPGPMAR
jgi:hypothetical protein